MFDKLEMRSRDEIDPDSLQKIFPRHQIAILPDRWYSYCAVIKKGNEHIFTLKTDANYGHVSPSKVIANPSKWKSFSELYNAISKVCDPDTLQINRIDHAVDLPVTIDTLYSGIRVRYKQGFDWYKEPNRGSRKSGKHTGFYMGKKPELYCCYDKGYQLEGQQLKRDTSLPVGEHSRIELRQWDGKIKYKTLAELPNYIEDSPFKDVEFYETDSSSKKGNELAELIESEGLSNVYHLKNQSRNFRRDYSALLQKTTLPDKMNEVNKENLRQFFEG